MIIKFDNLQGLEVGEGLQGFAVDAGQVVLA